ncbi:SDR family NAD(P)-dependent oxidoreductase [Ectothiorhodospiraceae bacterium BW-2]|nr:SDR family NAD(P)-dependent oxidoreductase [Ectothiorhodospiraceae bacterium BW-2]
MSEQGVPPLAVVGMSLRAPGADNLQQFWHNLYHGIESITFFSEAELRQAGVSQRELDDPDYVAAAGRLDGVELFDAAFFDFTPREAEILDPQHRLLLEGSWQALEHAAIDPQRYEGRIGLFAGVGFNGYLLHNLLGHSELLQSVGGWQLTLSNDKDFAATRVAYKLNLQGAAVSVNSACSTSLVATAMACQSLLSYQCDAIIAGGCSIHLPQDRGYLYSHGGTLSPDGHCRPFDINAAGTIDGNGVALVVLKRLEDAIAEGDTIHGLIRGFATNNDGSVKVGYTAPSVEGQSEVLQEALELADLPPEAISYIETHGTGTDLGDPIEISALKAIYGREGAPRCILGAVKSNIGHLDTAAGNAGLIKTLLALQQQTIPPTLHLTAPNPKLGLEGSRFQINHQREPWPQGAVPRRAGVSSFGIGGTNAHLVVEEAPQLPPSPEPPAWLLLPLAAKSAAALTELSEQLADYLHHHPELNLADVAATLQLGRSHFNQRQAWVVPGGDLAVAVARLRQSDSPWQVGGIVRQRQLKPIFLYPGQDAQFVNMAAGLYRDEPQFRAALQPCIELAQQRYGYDLLARLYPEGVAQAQPALDQGATTEPLPLFAVEYALTELWRSWGVEPQALFGYSLGEYVAAVVSGVLSLEDGIDLAMAGSALLKQMAPGAMIAAAASAEQLRPLLLADTHIALVMAANQCVVAGTVSGMAALQQQLEGAGVHWREVGMGLPFHTPLMSPFLAPFKELLERVQFHPPQIPYLSSVTGEWITAEQATSPDYYLRLAAEPLQIEAALNRILTELATAGVGVVLEIGPGQLFTPLVLQHAARPDWLAVIASQHDPRYSRLSDSPHESTPALLTALGRLWSEGVEIDWAQVASEGRRRLPLPGYPLQKRRFWIEPATAVAMAEDKSGREAKNGRKSDIGDWFYRLQWLRTPLPTATPQGRWLLLGRDLSSLERIAAALQHSGCEVVQLQHQPHQSLSGSGGLFSGDITDHELLQALFTQLKPHAPDHILHLDLWGLTLEEEPMKQAAFYAVTALARALGRHYLSHAPELILLADGLVEVTGEEPLFPMKSSALGPLKVMTQEYPDLTTRAIDAPTEAALAQLLPLLAEGENGTTVALRGRYRWQLSFTPTPLPPVTEIPQRLRRGGVYLITGGWGNIGLTLARYLAETVQATLILTGRSAPPPQAQWPQLLADSSISAKTRAQIVQLQAIIAAGAELRLLQADVADPIAMAELFANVNAQFGSIHGVIHAAGIVGEASFATLNEDHSPAIIEQQFRPKVEGALVLAQLLAEQPFDFCLICSSLSSILGGLGFSTYAATNLYVDALCNALNRQQPGRWLAVNWEGWDFENEAAPATADHLAALELGMQAEEGREAFARVLNQPQLERIVISSADLQQRIAQWIETAAIALESDSESGQSAATAHPRPELLGAYVAPEGEQEQRLAKLWQQLLGIEGIGSEDNFFELGGNSLLLTQLVAMVRREFQRELPLAALFESPTIRAMAAHLAVVDEGAEGEEWEEGVL